MKNLGDRRSRAKRVHQSSIYPVKIVNDEIIFVQGKGAKAEHTLTYVSISLSADLCEKSSPELYLPRKIVNDEIIFVQGKGAKAEHTLTYVSISISADLCEKSSPELYPPTVKIVNDEIIFVRD